MAALTNTAVGQAINDKHIQLYGGINAGGNFLQRHGARWNAPAAYEYNANNVQLDQAVR